jgi:hypothetical protein
MAWWHRLAALAWLTTIVVVCGAIGWWPPDLPGLLMPVGFAVRGVTGPTVLYLRTFRLDGPAGDNSAHGMSMFRSEEQQLDLAPVFPGGGRASAVGAGRVVAPEAVGDPLPADGGRDRAGPGGGADHAGDRAAVTVQATVKPPSRASSAPLTMPEASDASHTTASATSAGIPNRPSGIRASIGAALACSPHTC